VALQKLPVLFCLDRAGLSPNDGATHHGLFDFGYLRCIPGIVVMAPADEDELADMMATGLGHDGPAFIRYPRGGALGIPVKEEPETLEIGRAARRQVGQDVDIWAIGSMVADAERLAARLSEHGISAGVVNARFLKPLDRDALIESAKSASLIVTMEDHTVTGGLGTAVAETLQDEDLYCPVERIGWPDHFIEHGSSVPRLREENGLSAEAILERVTTRFHKVSRSARNSGATLS
jgi:1-deoxy-D-xylulose-5-phosphate synthase